MTDDASRLVFPCKAMQPPFLPRSYWLGRLGAPTPRHPTVCPILDQLSTPNQTRYIFVSGPPGTGTTALYALVDSSPSVASLCGARNVPQCEGWRSWHAHTIHALDSWAASAVGSGSWADIIWNVYRRVWAPKLKRIWVEKSPGVGLVWMPHIFDYLVSASVPRSSITFLLLTRSPCRPARERVASERLPAWCDPRIMKKFNASVRPPKHKRQIPPGTAHITLQLELRAELERTVATLDALQRRGAHAVVVDYDMMVDAPINTSMALEEVVPCLGRLDPGRPVDRHFVHSGRNESLLH